MKKLLAILLVLAMLLPLAACGGEDDPNAGKYQGVSAAVGGFSMPMSDIYPGETWIELKSGGKGTIMLDGDDFSIKWSLDDEDITISVQGADSIGTLKDGVITVDMMNMGCVMTFEKEGGAVANWAASAIKSPSARTTKFPARSEQIRLPQRIIPSWAYMQVQPMSTPISLLT